VQPYLERGYVVAKPVTENGLTSELYAAVAAERAEVAYLQEFVSIVRTVSANELPGVTLL
jgi:LysR family transcriptional regulator for metE and metH